MTPSFDVVGVGTNSVDRVIVLPAPLQTVAQSGKARMAGRHVLCGGQTATAMAAAAALGLGARYIGVFGSDADGRLMRQTLKERGVDVTYGIERAGPNRDAVILIEPDGRRTVLWQRPENVSLPAGYLQTGHLDARVMHVDDDDPDLALAAARLGREAGLTITTDLEHVNDRIEQLITTVSCPVFDENAPRALTGESDPERALRKLRRLTPAVLYMTLGDRGAVALDGDQFHAAPAFRVKVVDNTGAGDVFRAGLIYGLLHGWDVTRQLAFANATAALSCTRLGAIPSVPNLEEVRALLDRGLPK